MSTFANISNLLSEKDKMTIARIYDAVSSFQLFTLKTGFPLSISNRISELNTTKSDVEMFLSQLISNASGERNVKNLLSSFEKFSNEKLVPSNQSYLETLLFTDVNSFVYKVIDKFKSVRPPIGPSDSIPREYIENIEAVCTHIYYVLYQQLYKKLQNTGSAYTNSFPYMSFSTIDNICSKLTDSINNKIAFYPEKDTIDQFINRCYKAIYDPVINSFITDQLNCELFAISFLPFFALAFIVKFIAMPSDNLITNKAPRNGVIRRIAIQSVYELDLYVIYGTYLISTKYSPASNQTYELRMILDTVVTQIFDKESSYKDSEHALKKMHEDTKNALENNNKLLNISNDIEAVRNTSAGVQTIEGNLDKDIKQSLISFWIWTILMLIFAFYFILVAMFVRNKIYHDVYMIIGIIVLITLSIMGIVRISYNL